jgi:hypothetical protein
MSVEKGYALYEVDGGAMGTFGPPIAVCSTRERCEEVQNNQAVLKKFGPFTDVEEVDILVIRDAMGASCYVLADTQGFALDDIDTNRLKKRGLTMDWIALEKKNDWGSYYYSWEGTGLSETGTASVGRGLKLKDGQKVLVKWPDGTVQSVTLKTQKTSMDVSDHANRSTVVSDLFGFEVDVRGVQVWVEIICSGLKFCPKADTLASREDLGGDAGAFQALNDAVNVFPPKPVFQDVYEVYDTDCEGRTRMGTVGWYSSEAKADAEKGPYRRTGCHHAVSLDGQVYLLARKDPIDLDGHKAKAKAALKEKALAKLSPEERDVLGL